jgi:hypothetical protein
MNFKDFASQYAEYGLNALPTGIKDIGDKPDSRKVPFRIRVKKWQTMTTLLALDWWNQPDMDGIGISCGKSSGGLEVIDIDTKHDIVGNIWESFTYLIKDNLGDEFFSLLVIESTPSGGYHIFYRCEVIEGNLKLTWRPASPEELVNKPKVSKYCPIETRGEGGFIVCAPTAGYSLLQGSFGEIPTITSDERSILIDCAKALDTMPQQDSYQLSTAPVATRANVHSEDKKKPPFEVTPWDDFNEKNNIIDILYKYGWTVSEGASANGNEVRMIYSGKKNRRETAAVAYKDRNIVLVYSTSAGLEAGNSSDPKGHKPFGVFCHYEHRNDKKAAIEAAELAGYGRRKQPISVVKNSRLAKNDAPSVVIVDLPNKEAIIAKNECWLVEKDKDKEYFEKECNVKYCISLESLTDDNLNAIASYTQNICFVLADTCKDLINRYLPKALEKQLYPSIFLLSEDSYQDFFKTQINENNGDIVCHAIGEVDAYKMGWLDYRIYPIKDAERCEKRSERERIQIANIIAEDAVKLDYNRHPLLLGQMNARHLKFVRDIVKAKINERKAGERKELLDNADLTGVLITEEDGTQVMNQFQQLLTVSPYELAYPYQLPADAANECDWIVEVKGENMLQYIRIPNNKIGSVISVKNIFRNAKIRINIDVNQLDRLNSHLIMQSKTAEPVHVLGWHPEARMWFFADRAYSPDDNKFYLPNEVSIIEKGGNAYYLPYVDKANKAAPELLAFCYRQSTISFKTVSTFIRKAWGDDAFIFFMREVATWFLDFISVQANPLGPFFPIGFVQGKASSGKSTLIGIFKFFYASQIPVVSLRMNNTQAGIVSTMQMARNISIPFDDYGDPDAQMSVGDVSGMLVSLWNLRVGLKMNVENFTARANSSSYAAAMVSSNYPPKDNSNALQTRLLYGRIDKTERSQIEIENFLAGAEKISSNGLNDALIEVIKHRKLIEEHFKLEYKTMVKHLKTLITGYSIEGRVVEGYAMVAAVAKILMEKAEISMGGISLAQLYDIVRANIIKQYNALVQKQPLQLWWEYIQHAYEANYLVFGHHFDIDSTGFRLRSGTVLMEGEVLFIRFSSLYREYVKVCQQMGRKPEPEGLIKTMLQEHSSWEKTMLEDGTREISDVRVRKFDRLAKEYEKEPDITTDFPTTCWALYYEKLKDEFDIDLMRMERGKQAHK